MIIKNKLSRFLIKLILYPAVYVFVIPIMIIVSLWTIAILHISGDI